MNLNRCLVIHPALTRAVSAKRTDKEKLLEACGLAKAIQLEIADSQIVRLRQIRPSTYLGQGKVAELKSLIQEEEIGLVVMNNALSPIQQRNLERAWDCKVIDRTALILEIFGARARTAEGKLQVELASLEYQKSRLVRSWTHLERQRGGFGFLGGPGETQLEIDRRLISDRIAKIKQELETVRRTRALHRKSRKRVPYPIIALVGYTNAGKSTLFNLLTKAKVTAEDKLFATLDPTMRLVRLPSKRQAILSDTVGFISDLPTELVAAFRATLEEVVEADLLLHVRDAASETSLAEKEDVEAVLHSLGIPSSEKLLEVANKIDLLPPDKREAGTSRPGLPIAISALTGEGIEALLESIDRRLAGDLVTVTYTLPASDGKAIAWLHEHGEVLQENMKGQNMRVTVRLTAKDRLRFEREG